MQRDACLRCDSLLTLSLSNHKKEAARRLNSAIDCALREPSFENRQRVVQLRPAQDTVSLAERVRRRTTVLSRSEPSLSEKILNARDALISAIYAHTLPEKWFTGWCDGSKMETRLGDIAGIAGIITDRNGEIVARVVRSERGIDPFEAEIAALEALLETALEHGVEQIRAHTDCPALIQLWKQRRDDPRLTRIRSLAKHFRRSPA